MQLAKLEEAKSLLEIDSVRRLTKKINEVTNEMLKRNKLIRVAHRLAGSWMTVQKYMPDELTSGYDDSRRTPQLENMATKKRKLAFSRKHASTFSSAAQFHQSNVGNLNPPYTGNQFRNATFSSQRQGLNPLEPNNFR